VVYSRPLNQIAQIEPYLFNEGDTNEFSTETKRIAEVVRCEGCGLRLTVSFRHTATPTCRGRVLFFKRSFYFGAGGNIIFPATTYAQLKAMFDALHQQDNHSVALKLAETKQ